jgi:hypothetical protein
MKENILGLQTKIVWLNVGNKKIVIQLDSKEIN